MANTALTRPVVTMNLANRSIGRVGLLANRLIHPFAPARMAERLNTYTQSGNIRISSCGKSICIENDSSQTNELIPSRYFSKMLDRAGIDKICFPRGTNADTIATVLEAITSRGPGKTNSLFSNTNIVVFPHDVFAWPSRVMRLIHTACTKTYSPLIGRPYYYDESRGIRAFDALNMIGLSADQLDVLSSSEFPNVRLKVAQHPNTSADTLKKLVIGGNNLENIGITAFSQLEQRGLTPEELTELAYCRIAEVCKRIIAHPNVAADALIKMACHSENLDGYVTGSFDKLSALGISISQLDLLAGSYNPTVLERVASHPSTSPETLDKLVSYDKDFYLRRTARYQFESDRCQDRIRRCDDTIRSIRSKVANNPNTSVLTLEKLASGNDDAAVVAFCRLDRTSDQLALLAERERYRGRIAKHPNTSVHTLEKLANDAMYYAVFAFTALESKGLSPDQLALLANSKNRDVRAKVAQDPNTPSHSLIHMATHDNSCASVAFNNLKQREYSLSPEQLEALAKSPSNAVRIEVAKNQGTPEWVLGMLVNEDNDPEVKSSVAENPIIVAMIEKAKHTTDPELLSMLSQKSFPCVRGTVASNISTPQTTLITLSNDPRWRVRFACAMNVSLPAESVVTVLNSIHKDKRIIPHDITEKETHYCHDGESVCIVTRTEYETIEGYLDKSITLCDQILSAHDNSRATILELLKNANQELHEALTKNE